MSRRALLLDHTEALWWDEQLADYQAEYLADPMLFDGATPTQALLADMAQTEVTVDLLEVPDA